MYLILQGSRSLCHCVVPSRLVYRFPATDPLAPPPPSRALGLAADPGEILLSEAAFSEVLGRGLCLRTHHCVEGGLVRAVRVVGTATVWAGCCRERVAGSQPTQDPSAEGRRRHIGSHQ